MAKLIAAMNITLDGFCDHTAGIADEETHQHFTELLSSADTIIFGRLTYQLMEQAETVVENPTGNKSMDEFAAAIDNISKIVYSRTLENVDWKNTSIAKELVKEEILERGAARGQEHLSRQARV